MDKFCFDAESDAQALREKIERTTIHIDDAMLKLF